MGVMIKLTMLQLDAIFQEVYQGVATTLEQAVEVLAGVDGFPDITINDLTIADLQEIDNLGFECVVCGWWREASESDGESEEPTCQDCYGSEEE
jgi:hypothetical protein